MKASPAVRSLRAAVFAALCVLLATGGHALATGMVPPVWAQAAGFVPTFVTGWLLGGRERSLGGIGGGAPPSPGGVPLGLRAAPPPPLGTPHGTAKHPQSVTPTMT